MAFRRDIDPVAIPSAAMAAASRASSQASTVRRTKPECDGSGAGVFTLAVLIGKPPALLHVGSALEPASGVISECGTQSQKKHNMGASPGRLQPREFLLPPNAKATENRIRARLG